MPTAYLVAGPPSAGNRLVAAALVRSGCLGEGSDNQPKRAIDVPPPGDKPVVVIKHRYVSDWIRTLRAIGYDRVVVVVVVREPIANARSLVANGSVTRFDDARKMIARMIAKNVFAATSEHATLEVITYEGLNEQFLEAWLPRIGLPYVDGPLDLPGQNGPSEITNQNGKHYAECQR